ncbi:hypothetical protein [Thalassotalea agarivorans]|uniref:Uncharacterized protein n=1 Tax=Thalassotalea agarivorans TaxID=349064 RepID=A0A1I0GCX9_THASX|nr:hypothetical protein [Thalassotalea agarivorans]SET68868.1 hypothetical protein SAMN05660429_02419 [Thalassotalea agarivorans]
MNANQTMNKLFVLVLSYLFVFTVNANEVLLRPDNQARAYCHKSNKTICTVVVEGISTDVSAIENKNIGKLGIAPKEDYDNVVTFPSKWLRSSKDGDLIEFTTKAWLKGQVYTVRGTVFIDENGKYLHQ